MTNTNRSNTIFIIGFIGLILFLASCAVLKGSKNIVEIKLKVEDNPTVNHGNSFRIEVFARYDNGKEKDITSKSDLIISVEGGSYNNGRINLPAYPDNWIKDTVVIHSEYYTKQDTFRTQKIIPYNYLGEVEIGFSGAQGAKGTKGDDRSTPLIFRDGNDGGDGSIGSQGYPGDDINVLVWKDENTELFRIKVTNLNQNRTYYYTYKNAGYPFRIVSNGGPGGKGGDGGQGGTGKDGVVNEKKNKRPGNGGHGGDGGQGGPGGNGGTIYITIHPNAAELENIIVVYNFAGDGGQGGDGGEAGNSGDPAEGQDNGEMGQEGQPGVMGVAGNQGTTTIEIQPFDFEYE